MTSGRGVGFLLVVSSYLFPLKGALLKDPCNFELTITPFDKQKKKDNIAVLYYSITKH